MTSTILLVLLSVIIGALAMPVGMLPSIFGFRDLANGTDGSPKIKRAYATTLWTGLALSWILGTLLAYFILDMLTS